MSNSFMIYIIPEHIRLDGKTGNLAIISTPSTDVDKYGVPIISGYTRLLYLSEAVYEYNIDTDSYFVLKNRMGNVNSEMYCSFRDLVDSTELLFMNESIGTEPLSNFVVNVRTPTIAKNYKCTKINVDKMTHPEIYLSALIG
ncbi:hypothetical protein SEPL_302 [Salmonella phage SE_PL]|uniref:hypothetical protein n=1 Tax=Salmonella enterica TaxID=28901 RepID=UPI000FDFA00F|nr:hypothetical protein CPT_Munch_123 [Salmonella phage Munch]EAZ2022916.1 hypothetical protein [Salmonella enterica]ECV9084050.1 hypothetical protein [Salmonella enterica subsp. enterica serovar Infantis]MCP0435848.1 hypothetical protein [Salmonella enterica subsp. enterica serovar Mbandaka]QIG62915.1 hypothetical protein SEPL_302 [Salmonella phage SE_PL]WNV47230.1 hypothetical protein [Klebsiella phage fENko-Kae01]